MRRQQGGIGGWLLVLCVLLLVWQPISFGLVASSVLGRLATRGLPLALVLIARLLATAFGIGAGLALINRRPAAVRMTMVSLGLTAAVDVFVYTTSFFPSNRPPADTPWYVIASLAYAGIWMLYLAKAKRVRETFR
jgi:hypothetical protein